MSLEHYCTAPKYKVITILIHHMDICMLHPLCALYSFMWFFSVYQSHLYDFILNKFPSLLPFIDVSEN